MDRRKAERVINDVLYGTDTDIGRELLLKLVAEMGTAALTDEAAIKLAQLHENAHDESIDRLVKM